MFTSIVTELQRQMSDVKNIVQWQDELRAVLYTSSVVPADSTHPLHSLVHNKPANLAWRTFDHCASVTRIYALFEKAVCDVVHSYLLLQPKVSPRYEKLPLRLRQQHRVGVGQVLSKWSENNPSIGSIAEREICSGLADGLRGESYTLLFDAFMLSPENFRASAITRLFADLGFQDAFAFVSKHPSIAEFMTVALGNAETPESILNELVRIRNEAAHGSSSDLVSATLLINYADFTLLIVRALVLLLTAKLVQDGASSGVCTRIGDVIHVFSNNVIGVRSATSARITIGDRLYAGKRGMSEYRVRSLRIKDMSYPSLDIVDGLEFGLQLDEKVNDSASLYFWPL